MSSKKQSPSVHIIILNWNNMQDTSKCLESLQGLKYKNYELVVVDNGSKNHEGDQLKNRFPEIILIKNPTNLGFTGGCNTGIKYALEQNADYIFLLNNDTIVSDDFLGKLVDFYESTPDAGHVCPLTLALDKQTILYGGARFNLWTGIIRMINKGKLKKDVTLSANPYKTDYASGACDLVSTNLIKKIGMLDDSYFFYFEDTDWSYLAREHGYESYVVPTAEIYHKKSASTNSMKRFSRMPAFYLARNGLLFSKRVKGAQKIVYIISQYLIRMPTSLIFLIQFKAWPSYLKGLAHGTLKRVGKYENA